MDEGCFAAYSDEALVEWIQRGTGEAEAFGRIYAVLLERLLPVIHARVYALGGDAASEDLLQEGMLGFLRAVSAFSPERGASFRTFAAICVGNRVITALRRKQQLPQETRLLECDLPPTAEAMDPQDIFSAMEQTRQVMEVIQNELTEMERGVMEGYLAGERYDDIARRLNVTPKAVDNSLQRVRRKLHHLRHLRWG